MKRSFSDALQADIVDTVNTVLVEHGVLNIPVVAADISRRNEAENVAIEDIEYAVLHHGERISAMMEFDGIKSDAGLAETSVPDKAIIEIILPALRD